MAADVSSRTVRNVLLRAMAPSDFDLLALHLEPVELAQGARINDPNAPIDYAYFPESGLASVIAEGPSRRRVEIGLFGLEGMFSTALILGVESTPHLTFLQIGGVWLRIPADTLRAAMAQSASLHGLLMRHVQSFLVGVAATARANALYPVNARLARWLLMAHDRVEGDDLPLTHEFLAIMLGVHRPGVTLALHELEAGRAVKARRGAVTVADRGVLERVAGDGYGIAEREYERLIGPFTSKRTAASPGD